MWNTSCSKWYIHFKLDSLRLLLRHKSNTEGVLRLLLLLEIKARSLPKLICNQDNTLLTHCC